MRYQEAIDSIWKESNIESQDSHSKLQELIRIATLAPSSHNTQCWKFRMEINEQGDDVITILPDLTRRCPVVDPEDHHVYVTLGCALENLVLAAKAHGYKPTVVLQDITSGIRVELQGGQSIETSPRYDAIPSRQVTRAEYNGESLSNEEIEKLQQAVQDQEDNQVHLELVTERESITKLGEEIVDANTEQVQDQPFRDELEAWIRFGEQESIEQGDGLTAVTTGNPFIPRWIGQYLFRWTFGPTGEASKIRKQVASSAGLAIFVAQNDTPSDWVQVGRAYQRFALEATIMGVKTAFLNQPIELAEHRRGLADEWKLQGLPDLLVRFGKGGPALPHSLRRPVESVLEKINS